MQLILNSYVGLEILAGSAFDLVFDNTEPSSNPWGKISGVLPVLGKYQVVGGILSTYKISSESGEVVSCRILLSSCHLSRNISIERISYRYSNSFIMNYGILIMTLGMKRFPAGRLGDGGPSTGLFATLKNAGLKLGRLQTGTLARLDGNTINFSGIPKSLSSGL